MQNEGVIQYKTYANRSSRYFNTQLDVATVDDQKVNPQVKDEEHAQKIKYPVCLWLLAELQNIT